MKIKFPRPPQTENIEVVPLDKTDGAFCEDNQTLRMQRHVRMKEHFQGTSPLSTEVKMMRNAWFPALSFGPMFVHYGSFPLSAMNLLQFTTHAVPQINERGQMTTVDQISRETRVRVVLVVQLRGLSTIVTIGCFYLFR